MKKDYAAPRVEKMDFDYSDKVTASDGGMYREYIHNHEGCNDTPTNNWFLGQVRENNCQQVYD